MDRKRNTDNGIILGFLRADQIKLNVFEIKSEPINDART